MLKEGEDLDRTRSKSSRVAPVLPPPSMNQEHTCRICMDTETLGNPLISPCKCSGSVKYLHEECLKTWIISQDCDIDEGQCELCKTKFLMDFKIGQQCSISESTKHGWSPFFYLPILTIVMIMLFLVIALLSERYITIEQGKDEQGYTVALMITCGISGFVLMLLILSTLKEICLTTSLIEWRIFSQNLAVESVEDEKDETWLRESAEVCDVLIIPENLVVKGVKVKTPVIKPNLPAMNQRGRIVAYASRSNTPMGRASPDMSMEFRGYTEPHEAK